jgi:nucleoside-diphosphate-sugar epimerase
MNKGAVVKVVDNLSSGKTDNIARWFNSPNFKLVIADLLHNRVAEEAVQDIDVVFHLAADHGGRGYVDLHNAQCSRNLWMDSQLFDAAFKSGVGKVVYASSGCVYPNFIQQDTKEELYLTEDKVGPPYDSDNLYGWAKLMAELTLKAYYDQYGMKSANCRYFTVYGPKGKEDHAVIAMIARAFLKQDPFDVWGDGTQIRNWTYIDDIADGTVLAAEHIDDATAINLGTMERTTVTQAVGLITGLAKLYEGYEDYNPKFNYLLDMPTGPLNRVADNTLAKELLGWEPKITFNKGVINTMKWYFESKTPSKVELIMARGLTER